MSAVAFAVTKPKIILLSDGMATQDGEVIGTDHSKIHKINGRVAILWMGIGPHALSDPLKEQIKTAGLTEPEDIARAAGRVLKSGFKDKQHLLQTLRFWVTTIGYDRQGTPVGYQLDSQEEYRYEPIQAPIKPGMIGSMVNGFEYNQAPFSKLLATKYLPLFQDLERAAKQAFNETVERCKQNLVGGELYYQELLPAGSDEALSGVLKNPFNGA